MLAIWTIFRASLCYRLILLLRLSISAAWFASWSFPEVSLRCRVHHCRFGHPSHLRWRCPRCTCWWNLLVHLLVMLGWLGTVELPILLVLAAAFVWAASCFQFNSHFIRERAAAPLQPCYSVSCGHQELSNLLESDSGVDGTVRKTHKTNWFRPCWRG